ncbi:alpha/beta-hydrolase [Basidiobolus meristosporus CBS 931.73]|uniref:Alpha/beta-hydrolase n=1 Tax=Basidiobolus meristosporus CBS 931.73 TaxID=1314790 RepID=A0A1Y1YMC7_9FUNG|nr:alpha/beta-hydrolase [Basidiobolus meristosporus CBS 931.73]|eukprot:ORX99162.1 alpha/beta-hydrolase [Basidiobolus meristosporus CBS 931.73]
MKDFVFDDANNTLLFIGTDPAKHFQTTSLFVVDLPPEPMQTSSAEEEQTPSEAAVPVIDWKPLLSEAWMRDKPLENLSKEEILHKERQRLALEGITSVSFEPTTRRIMFPYSNNIYVGTLGLDKGCQPLQVKSDSSKGPRLDPKLGGRRNDLIAFVRDRDLWTSTLSGEEVQLTYCSQSDDTTISCGMPEFIIQEEFERYTGYYWAPETTQCKDNLERILYLQVSESMVSTICMLHGADVEAHRYPRCGTINAMCDMQIVEFSSPNDKSGGQCTIIHKRLWGSATLKEMFPWMEYVVRFGWIPNGKAVWAQLMDRKQQKTVVVKIPLKNFATMYEYNGNPNYEECKKNVEILYHEESDSWINYCFIYHFLETQNEDFTEFIWCSERTGYRHLYLVRKFKSSQWFLKPLTVGEWVVADIPIRVDTHRKLIYFVGKRDTPLENHLYVASMAEDADPDNIVRLTPLGFFHNVQMNPSCTRFVSWYSNIKEAPSTAIYELYWEGDSIFPKTRLSAHVHPLGVVDKSLPVGEFFSFENKQGDTIYGCFYKPDNYVQGQKYPTILYVYGGPKGQAVTNDYKCPRFLPMFLAIRMGFAVVMIDGRGSSDRGLAFESQIRGKLGTVELEDQAGGIQYLLKHRQHDLGGVIDASKIAITGWSYGGYISLLALAHYPEIFKISIPGAPVTHWKLYDTAYSERYMGLLEENAEGYRKASVLSYIDKFPDDEHRLLLIHGLIDENVHFTHTEMLVNALIRANKPHQLQVYPYERHGLRHPSSTEHFDTLMFYWLRNYL